MSAGLIGVWLVVYVGIGALVFMVSIEARSKRPKGSGHRKRYARTALLAPVWPVLVIMLVLAGARNMWESVVDLWREATGTEQR